MPASSTAAAFVAGLKTQLEARPGLSGITVYLVAPADTITTDKIILIAGPVTGEQEYVTAGRARRSDTYTIPGALAAYRTGQNTETTMQAAWDAAAALLDEIASELRDNAPQVGDQTLEAHLAQIRYTPQPSDRGGWVCVCEFQAEYTARVT